MKITVIDGSNYLRGLLLLIRKDKKITQVEIELMKHVGNTLGFEKTFCDNAISEILGNKYIVDAPPLYFQRRNWLSSLSKTGFVWHSPTMKFIPLKNND